MRRGTVLGIALLGAAITAAVALPDWVRGTVDDPVLGHHAASASGQAAAPALLPLGLLALAAVAVSAVTGRAGRMLGGALAAAAGLGAAWFAVGVLRDGAAVLARSVAGSVGRSGTAPVSSVSVTAWPWLALLGGVLAALGGIAIAYGGPGWSGMSSRYERPAQHQAGADPSALNSSSAPDPTEPGPSAPGPSASDPSASDPAEPDRRESPPRGQAEEQADQRARRKAVEDWDSLSRGEDPTT